ncbi:MAG: tetratricopeptide repeat protein [Candidatus Hodarchaeales archaeon]
MTFKGGFQINMGDIENAIDNFQKSMALYEDIGDNYAIYYQLNNIGWIYRVQGKLDQAMDYFQKQLNISEEIGEKKYISWSNYSLGYGYFYDGDLKRAAEHAHKCLGIFEELKHETGILDTYTLIGSIHRGKGELDKSLEYYHKILSSYDEALEEHRTVIHSVCISMRDIGMVYYNQNRITEAIEFFKRAIKTHQTLCKYKNSIYDFELALVNFWLIISSIEIEDFSQVEEYLEEINLISDRFPWLHVFSKIAEAYLLKSKSRAKDKIKAQQLLEESLDEKFDYEMEFIVQVNLCELLLDELKFYGGEEVIQEIQGLLNKISIITDKQRSITTLVVLYSLQARLSLIEGNAEIANKLLTRALVIAKDKGLDLFSKKLIRQQDLLFDQLGEWKEILDRNSSLQSKIEQINLQSYIDEAIKVREKVYEKTV